MVLRVGKSCSAVESVEQLASHYQVAHLPLCITRRSNQFHRAVLHLCRHRCVCRRVKHRHAMPYAVIHILRSADVYIRLGSYMVGIAASAYGVRCGVAVLVAPVKHAVEEDGDGNRCGGTGLYLRTGKRTRAGRSSHHTHDTRIVAAKGHT